MRCAIPLLLFVAAGCQMAGSSLTRAQNAVPNPVVIYGTTPQRAWEPVVDVLHDFGFRLPPGGENRLEGTIETDYRVGSGILEPWHKDSKGLENRLESTLQSIRRKVTVSMTPSESGVIVLVRAFKESEELAGLSPASPGAATFRESDPLQRDLDAIVGQTGSSGWVSQGRDVVLEQAIAKAIVNRFSRR